MRISLVGLILAGGLAVSGCASNGLYSGVSVGTGFGYGSYGYGGYGHGYGAYGSPYWGWYDGFYYPGSGFYVYDRYRRAFYWNDRYRRYWTDRRHAWSGPRSSRAIWEGFARNWADRRTTVQSQQRILADTAPSAQVQTRQRIERAERQSARSERAERQSARSERAETRRARRVVRDETP